MLFRSDFAVFLAEARAHDRDAARRSSGRPPARSPLWIPSSTPPRRDSAYYSFSAVSHRSSCLGPAGGGGGGGGGMMPLHSPCACHHRQGYGFGLNAGVGFTARAGCYAHDAHDAGPCTNIAAARTLKRQSSTAMARRISEYVKPPRGGDAV